jgi:WS/DGAT/MGAT family acyltransferase
MTSTTRTGTASQWGSQPEMSDVEAIFWRAEVNPRLRSGGVVLDVLDSTPDWSRLIAAHEWATRLVPRLRQRVVDDPFHLGPPAWVTSDVDLDYHLRRVTLEPEAGFDRVLEIAGELHVEPFDPARPLWRAVLVEGLYDGSSAYLFKVHHSMADGQGMVQLFNLLHSDRREFNSEKVWGPRIAAERTEPLDLSARRAQALAREAPRELGRLATGLGRKIARTVSHPNDLATALTYTQSLGRVTTASLGTPSPLLRTRGLERRLRTIDVRLAELRAAGRAANGSVNDAFMAGLLGGLRRYHLSQGIDVGDLPIALPVSLRGSADEPGGNRFAGARIAGPAAAMDPGSRIAMIHERVARARNEPALDFMGATAPIASRLPNGLLAGLAIRLSQAIDLQASNIPGLGRASYIGGARIERMYVFGPVPGSAVMVTLVSHEGMCCIGVTTDHAAIPDPDRFVADLWDGLAEVVEFGQAAL